MGLVRGMEPGFVQHHRARRSGRARVVRDAVHGDIELTGLEWEIIDTAEFQRLRGIRQLGMAYLAYPSALHSRFEHSQGVCWLTERLLKSVGRERPVSERERVASRMAALLHDLTHIPFAHTLEDECGILPRHDGDCERQRALLEESVIGDVLRREGLLSDVLAILAGTEGTLSDIISGVVSADLLDYLRRDAFFCGLRPWYDDRILDAFEESDGRLIVSVSKRGVFRHDALSELINLLRIRYWMYERVYCHPIKLNAGAMVARAVELAIEKGLDIRRFNGFRDDAMLWALKVEFAGEPDIQHLLECLDRRWLYRTCYCVTTEMDDPRQSDLERRFYRDRGARQRAEREIAHSLGIEPHQVIVYCPSTRVSHPDISLPVRMADGTIATLTAANNTEIRNLMEKYAHLWRFAVFFDETLPHSRDELAATAEEYFHAYLAPKIARTPERSHGLQYMESI